PFAVEGEARENLVMTQREPGRVDAFGLHQTETEIAEMVIIRGCDRQLHATHRISFWTPPLPLRFVQDFYRTWRGLSRRANLWSGMLSRHPSSRFADVGHRRAGGEAGHTRSFAAPTTPAMIPAAATFATTLAQIGIV